MSLTNNNNNRIAVNTVLLSVRMVFILGLNLFATRIVLSALGVEDFGIYSVVAGFVSMLSFLNTSLANGIQRFFNFELGKNGLEGARLVFNIALIIQALLILVVLLIAETIGLWYINNVMVIPHGRLSASNFLFQFSVISFIIAIIQVPYMAAIMAHEDISYYSIISVIEVLLRFLAAVLISIISDGKLVIYGALMMVACIFSFLSYMFFARIKYQEIRLGRHFDKKMFKSMLSFSGWNVFGSMAGVLKEQGLNMVLNYFFGPVVNAARGVAAQVSSGLQSFVVNINTTTRPQLTQSYAKGDYNRAYNLFYSSSKLSFMLLFIFAYPIGLEINYVLHLWLGENVPEYTESFFIWVLLTAAIGDLNGPVSAVVHATGNMRKYQTVCSFILLSVIPLSIIAYLISNNPTLGFILGFIVSLIGHMFSLIILKEITGLTLTNYMKKVVFPLFKTILVSFPIPFLFCYCIEESFLRFALVVITGVLSVALSFYFLGMNQTEKNVVKSLVVSIKNKL